MSKKLTTEDILYILNENVVKNTAFAAVIIIIAYWHYFCINIIKEEMNE